MGNRRKNLESLGYLFHPGHKVPISDGYLDEMNIQVNDAGAWMLRGIYRPDTVAAENILETITDVSQGTIVVKNSWKSNDQAVPKATWTDMVHDNWMDACANADRGAKDPKSLKYVVRDNIQFKDTVDSNGIKLNTPTAMITVFDKLSADKTKTLTIDAKSTNTDVKASYELLSAQTHVARVLQWLKDRHTDLGDKKIAKLHLFHSEHTDGGYNMVIEVA